MEIILLKFITYSVLITILIITIHYFFINHNEEVLNYDSKKEIITVNECPTIFQSLFRIKNSQIKKYIYKREDYIFHNNLRKWYDYETGEIYGKNPNFDKFVRQRTIK